MEQEAIQVTIKELHNITNSPKFISQTPADESGNYTELWGHNEKRYIVKRNLFNW